MSWSPRASMLAAQEQPSSQPPPQLRLLILEDNNAVTAGTEELETGNGSRLLGNKLRPKEKALVHLSVAAQTLQAGTALNVLQMETRHF